ncbi:NAD(P)/FAD-dependent oxidoreductase [soil metagenome]
MDTTTDTKQATDDSEATPRYDVVVVGGGAAGLSATLAMARARRSVLVIDAGDPRNAPAGHVHNYLGREGTPPLELLAIGRAEVEAYGAEVVTDRVTVVERLADGTGFRIGRRDGPPVEARRLLVTTGLTDVLPDIPGLADHWGTDVLHCPYCHGWEVRDQPVVVLATNAMAAHQALMWSQWTDDLTVVLHGVDAPAGDVAEQLEAVGVLVIEGPVASVEEDGGRLSGLVLANGRIVPCTAVVVAARVEARAELLDQLGLRVVDLVMAGVTMGTHVEAELTGATSVPGVFVAGNVTSPTDTVIAAAASGLRTAAGLSFDLTLEDANAAAVAAARTHHTALSPAVA